MIYFLKRKDGAIKIGTSNDFETRIRNLAAEYDGVLLLGLREGGYVEEKELHKRFSDFALGGEWFSPCQELIDYIKVYAELANESQWIERKKSRSSTRLISQIPTLFLEKCIRDKHRYSQQEVAKLLGLTESSVSRTLNDKAYIGGMTLRTAKLWCDWLGCEHEDLGIREKTEY